MISNKNGLELFYYAFKEAADGDYFLDQTKFHFAIVLLSNAIYGHEQDEEKNPFQEMYTNLLIDKAISPNLEPVGGRLPSLDEDVRLIMSEEAFINYLAYVDQLKSIFHRYTDYSMIDSLPNVLWREIADKNLGVSCSAFMRMCLDNDII